MPASFRFPHLAGVLLLAAAPFAAAESPLPDPVAPAVVGRPLDRIKPARPARQKPAAPAAKRPRPVVAGNKAVAPRPSAQVAVAPAAVQPPAERARSLGAFFSGKDQAVVRKYYAANPVTVKGRNWKVGERMPERAELTGVPDDVRAALPVLPRGLQYVQLDAEVVLVAVQSRIVVDGVSREIR